MNAFWTGLLSIVKAFLAHLFEPAPLPVVTPPTPTAPAKIDPVQTMVAITLADTATEGPFPGTGGMIHAIDSATATQIATLIVEHSDVHLSALSKKSSTDYALLLAGFRQESRFDPKAYNPNNQLAKAGETPLEAFLHADVGLAQFDGATLMGMTQFANMTFDQVQQVAEDPNWAVPAFIDYLDGLLEEAHAQVTADAAILNHVPGKSVLVLGLEAYNAGSNGAKQLAYEGGDFTYATAWLDRANQYAKILGEVPYE